MTKYAPKSDIIQAKLEDKVVLLNLTTGIYFELNATGAMIWDVIQDSPKDLAQITQHVQQSTEHISKQVEREVQEFLNSMLTEELAEVHSD